MGRRGSEGVEWVVKCLKPPLAYIRIVRRRLTTAFCNNSFPEDPTEDYPTLYNMKYLAVICLALVGAASAGLIAPYTTLLRTPSLDSAVIKSERLGGNFAYSSVEGHSYAAVAPVVQHVATPVAVSYQAHAPVVTGVTAYAHAPAIIAAPAYAHSYPLHYPIGFGHPAIIAEAPVAAAPVADATPVEAAPAPVEPASDAIEVEAA